MAIGPERLFRSAQVELVATLILGGQRFPAGTWTIEYSALEQASDPQSPPAPEPVEPSEEQP